MRLFARLSRLSWALVVLGEFTRPAMAEPFSIQVLAAQYTVGVSANTEPATSRTTTSLEPFTDTVVLDGWDEIRGTSDLFGVEALTDYSRFNQVDPPLATRASASATSALMFAPLIDGTATLALTFDGLSQVWWTQGLVRLEDLTTGYVLQEYGYSATGCCKLTGPGPIPWLDPSDGYNAQAAFAIEQSLFAAHEYLLTMHTISSSVADREGMSIHVSGLLPVPEPSCLLLSAGGVLCIGVWRSLRRHRNA